MRRKNRKWVAIAVALYLFVIWSAYRWGVAQRPTDGNLFEHIEREAKRKNAEEAAKAAAVQPKPTGESRLTAAGPAYVAARYDATHVVFMVAAETESRFAARPQFGETPTKLPAPAKPAAPLAGFQELWQPDSQALHFFPEIVQKTQRGERWSLSVSPDSTIPVAIDRTVIAPTGCSLALGFLASVPPDQQPAFAASRREYFAVRHNAVESAATPIQSHIAELPDWKPTPAMRTQIEPLLNERMKQEVANIDARLLAHAAAPGATPGESPGHAHPRLKEWIHADRGLTRGEGTLDYEVRAFNLTPDAVPRLFVRARWKLVNTPVFLMTAWFKAESLKAVPSKPEPPAEGRVVLLTSDSSWSTALREGEALGALGDSLDFQTILNEFDADHDGWAELLIHSDQGSSTTIALYLYTDLGLVPMKTPLRRDTQSPESCVDP